MDYPAETEKLLDIVKKLQLDSTIVHQENAALKKNLTQLSTRITKHQSSETQLTPIISLPDKFDGTRQKFRGFINQVRLVISMQPERFASDHHQTGFIG